MNAVVEKKVSFAVGSATLTMPVKTLLLSLLMGDAAPEVAQISAPVTARIGSFCKEVGGVYAGVIAGENGNADYQLFLLPDEATDVNFDQACAWSEKINGELPTRREQRLLFINLKSEFEPSWYWSGEQYAPDPSDAWGQNFDNGNQYYYDKSAEGRARAVRRLPI